MFILEFKIEKQSYVVLKQYSRWAARVFHTTQIYLKYKVKKKCENPLARFDYFFLIGYVHVLQLTHSHS